MLLQNIKENFRLYLVMILIVYLIVTLSGCSDTPTWYNLDNPIYENMNLYCEYNNNKEVCDHYSNYNNYECELWENERECENLAQIEYEQAIDGFSKVINEYYGIE